MSEVLLMARNVSFGYRSSARPIIHDFSAAFARNTMTAIVGPSGAGKSSLLFLLGLMLQPTSGEVIVGDRTVPDRSDRERSMLRAETFGFVFQDSLLDPRRTVLDNVLQPGVFKGERRKEWIESAEQLLTRMGVTVPLTRRPGQVSGGQAQRIALCRALLGSPAIILADEPTGNLDPDSANAVTSELRRRAQDGAAVVVVTHSRDMQDSCDRSIVLTPVQ